MEEQQKIPRRTFKPQEKLKILREVVQGEKEGKRIGEIIGSYGVHYSMYSRWKEQYAEMLKQESSSPLTIPLPQSESNDIIEGLKKENQRLKDLLVQIMLESKKS